MVKGHLGWRALRRSGESEIRCSGRKLRTGNDQGEELDSRSTRQWRERKHQWPLQSTSLGMRTLLTEARSQKKAWFKEAKMMTSFFDISHGNSELEEILEVTDLDSSNWTSGHIPHWAWGDSGASSGDAQKQWKTGAGLNERSRAQTQIGSLSSQRS